MMQKKKSLLPPTRIAKYFASCVLTIALSGCVGTPEDVAPQNIVDMPPGDYCPEITRKPINKIFADIKNSDACAAPKTFNEKIACLDPKFNNAAWVLEITHPNKTTDLVYNQVHELLKQKLEEAFCVSEDQFESLIKEMQKGTASELLNRLVQEVKNDLPDDMSPALNYTN